MLSLAEQLVFERYKHPLFAGVLANPTNSAQGENASCGDEVAFTVRIANNQIVEICHTCRACAVCTASADFLCESLTGKPVSELENFKPQEVVGIPLSPTRLRCAELPKQVLSLALQGDS